ncbi:universal stress protein [Streptomyces flavalbus]|uniref:Universal stress protein n=1 Tax=Streptomyces flavalbus TaxID=2665155 RepID=A0ABW2WJL3_9ACTN
MTTTERPLVVGVDGSDGSLAAVDWAVDEAARHGVPLRLVYGSLWERYESLTLLGGGPKRPAERLVSEHVVAAAAERARRREPGVKLFTAVHAQDPAEALLGAADDAFALVTGHRGRGELKGLLLGSVSLAVAARAHCPVIVVRGDRAALTGGHGRVLLGAGEPGTGDAAARFAVREAEVRGDTLDAVRAWRCPAHESADVAVLAEEPARYHEDRAITQLEELLRDPLAAHPAVTVRRTTVEGQARRVLVRHSAAADLVVVGARRRQGHFGLQLGRVAHTLLHHAACPVAVVPQEA